MLGIFAFLLLAASMAHGTGMTVFPTNIIREIAVGDAGSGPAMVAVDDNDDIWVALAKSGKLARLRNGRVDTFDVGANSRPVGLVAVNGILWIAASYDNKIIRFDPRTQAMQEFPIDGDNSWPFVVAADKTGTLWFSERAAGRVGRFDPATSTFKHFDVPTPSGGPAGLAVDPTSGTIWFSESYADRVARLDPRTGTVTEIAMGDSSTGLVTGPAGLTVDLEGDVWFAKLEGKLGHIRRGATTIDLIDTPPQAKRPAGIVADARGHLWIVALDGNCLLEYKPREKSFAMYPLPTGSADAKPSTPPSARSSRPFGLAVDHHGDIWFSEQYTGQLGVIDVAPPSLSILSPAGVVRTASTLLTTQALDRVSDVHTVATKIDGRPAEMHDGRLDLASLGPGEHTVEVVVADAADHRTSASVAFRYAPGPFAVEELIDRSDGDPAAKAELLRQARSLTAGDPRETLSRMLDATSVLRGSLVGPLRTALQFQLRTGGSNLEVHILDGPPYFSPATLVVKSGDTVRWKYDPPSNGHEMSHNLQRIVISSVGVSSAALRAGESFSYRFEKPGEFAIRNVERGADSSLGTIRVVAP